MRRGRILIFLLLIVVVGVGVLAVGLGLFNPVSPVTTTQEAPGIEVYFASQRILQGDKITQDLVQAYRMPQELVTEFMFTAGEEVNLFEQYARFTLEPGTLITSSMVGAGPGELAGPPWATNVLDRKVAMAIPTNRLATAAYGISDGAHVNVNACMTFVDVDPAYQSVLPNYVSVMRDIYFPENDRPYISIEPLTLELPARQGRVELDPTFAKPIYTVPSETQRPRLVCQMILQDVVVLKLGTYEWRQPSTDPNATPVAVQQNPPDIITLMVDPQESIALNYFVYSGAVITMSLRNPNDTSRIEAESATLTSVLTQYNISLPSKLPYAQQPRLDVLAPPLLPNDIINVQPQQ